MITYARSYAQVNFNITSSNISQPSLYVDNATINYVKLVSLVPTISLRSTNLALTGNSTIALSPGLFTARVVGTGGNLLNLETLSGAQLITLSNSDQPIYAAVLGALASGAINIRYSIPGLSATAWKAGTYQSTLNFTLSGVNLGSINPTSAFLNLTVDPFITTTASVNALQLVVNSLDYFRNTTLSGNFNLSNTITVPYGIKLKTGAANFTYSNGYSGSVDPLTPSSRISAQVTAPNPGSSGTLSNGYTAITGGGVAVPIGNQQTNTISISIKPADLKAGFIQKGTYTNNLYYQVYDTQTTSQATAQSASFPISVIVNDLAELKVAQSDIYLNYNTAGDYASGTYFDAGGHLILSKTTPYDLYVQASTLANGSNTLPVSVLSLSPSPGYEGSFSTISLSTSQQKLISGGTPVVDRTLNVRFAIPASQSSQLLGKAAGTYNTTLTYLMVAP